MRAESWMDHTPRPTRTPLQIAEADVRHWSDRLRSLTADLLECGREFNAAIERREKMERHSR